jgi:hypothetical protein
MKAVFTIIGIILFFSAAQAQKIDPNYAVSVMDFTGEINISKEKLLDVQRFDIVDAKGVKQDAEIVAFDFVYIKKAANGSEVEHVITGTSGALNEEMKDILSRSFSSKQVFIEQVKFKISGSNEVLIAKPLRVRFLL